MEIYNDDVKVTPEKSRNEGEFVKIECTVDLDASVKLPEDCKTEHVNTHFTSFDVIDKCVPRKSFGFSSSGLFDDRLKANNFDVKTESNENEDKIIFKFDLGILDKIEKFLVSTDKAIDKESVEKEILDFGNTIMSIHAHQHGLSEDEVNHLKENFKKEAWNKYRMDIIDSFTKIFWFGHFILGLQPNEIVDMVEEHYNK